MKFLCLLLIIIISGVQASTCNLEYRPQENAQKFKLAIHNQEDYQGLLRQEKKVSYIKYTLDNKSFDHKIYFQNTTLFDFHYPFLSTEIQDFLNFSNLTYERYIYAGPEKRLTAGAIYFSPCNRYPEVTVKGLLGFTIYFKQQIDIKEIQQTYKVLKERVHLPGTIAYLFERPSDFSHFKRELEQLGIPSLMLSALWPSQKSAVVYHAAKSYGVLKKISIKELSESDYFAKDILILDQVPLDIGPTSGLITSHQQSPNSHIILRAINQNIPDVFIPDVLENEKIIRYLNQLVEFSTDKEGHWTIRGADQIGEDQLQKLAQKYFENRVPELPNLSFDLKKTSFYNWDKEAQIDVKLAQSYGAKGVNFAILDKSLGQNGFNRSSFSHSFLIPFSAYAQHLEQIITKDVCAKSFSSCQQSEECQESFALCQKIASNQREKNTLKELLSGIMGINNIQRMIVNGKYRKSTLKFIQKAIENTPINSIFLSKLSNKLEQSFSKKTRIRFRSSTNAEDLPGLNGAGLYDSKSVCLGDHAETSEGQSSECLTPFEKDQKEKMIISLLKEDAIKYASVIEKYKKDLTQKYPLDRALAKVYSSLWNERAFLFRDYYRLNHLDVYMGILVHPAFVDESANGVILFNHKDKEMVVNVAAQIQDISVTNPDFPEAVADQFVFRKMDDADWQGPRFDLHSNLLSRFSQKKNVLSKEQMQQTLEQVVVLAGAMEKHYGKNRSEIYDSEFIVNAEGQVLIKQIRPLGLIKNEVMNVKGSYEFTYHNHQWNEIKVNLQDKSIIISTPTGDEQDTSRNVTFGFRPKLTYNQFQLNQKISSRWLEQFPTNTSVYQVFCKSVSDLILKLPNVERRVTYKIKEFVPFFKDIGTPSDLKTCALNIAEPTILSSNENYTKYTQDLLCIVSPSKEWGSSTPNAIVLYLPFIRTPAPRIPYLEDWPNQTIKLCIDDKVYDIQEKTN